jgi:hypothetical protein
VKKPVLVGLLIVAAIAGLMVYSMLGLTKHRVEVCIQFKGITRCKIASGATQEAAFRQAVDNACGELASGVTEAMACPRTEPTKVTILK